MRFFRIWLLYSCGILIIERDEYNHKLLITKCLVVLVACLQTVLTLSQNGVQERIHTVAICVRTVNVRVSCSSHYDMWLATFFIDPRSNGSTGEVNISFKNRARPFDCSLNCSVMYYDSVTLDMGGHFWWDIKKRLVQANDKKKSCFLESTSELLLSTWY